MRGQRDHVEIGSVLVQQRLAQALFGATARQEQGKREAVVVLAFTRVDEDLLDTRQGVLGQLSADRIIAGDYPPALQRRASARQFFVQNGATLRRLLRVVRQEHQTGGIARADGDARVPGQCAKECIGFADQQAAAVAGETIGGDAAAVGHARQRGNRGIDQRTRRLVVELHDHAETAGVAFVVRVVESLAVAAGHLVQPGKAERLTPISK